ncbi:MAG TPA: chloride channel protein [Acidimicrobiia bacterium]|nr:chloride channel protein [Acidimicrobiia bacterium]
MRSSPGRLVFMSLLATVLGLAGGAAAWLLVRLIALLTNAALLHQYGWDLPSFRHFHPGPDLLLVAMAGGLLVALIARWSPVIRGHGIPEAMEAVLTRHSRISPRAAVAKPTSAAVAIGTGGPFGAEGPIIVTGGALGSLVGQVIRVSPSERKILLACGAAAGMAGVFGAPLASVVLAVELLLFEFSARALVPLVVSASIAAGVHAALFGSGPLFTVPHHDFAGLSTLGVFAVLGIVCGLLAVVVAKGLFVVEAGYRRLPIPQFWHPIIGGLGFALIGLAVPRALGVGYDAIDDVLASRITVGALALLLLAKLVMWWIALGSGTSGGTLAPLLLIGGTFGGLVGAGLDAAFPSFGLSPGAVALVAMAATFGAATGAVFTSIVFAFELTRDYQAVLPLMLAAVLADIVFNSLSRHSLMTEKLARRGVIVPRRYAPDALQVHSAREAMTANVVTLPVNATIAEARRLLESGGHGAYPLVDDSGGCAGIVSRGDLLVRDVSDGAPVKDIATAAVVTVEPEDSLLTVLERMTEDGVDHVPVVDHDRLIGICTRTDLLRARSRYLEHERPQAGWRPRLGRVVRDGHRTPA